MTPPPVQTPWLVALEAAAYARINVKTLYREVKAGRLRAATVGGRRALRWRREYLDEWLEQTATPVEVVR